MKGINFMIELSISIILLSITIFLLQKNNQQTDVLDKYKIDTFDALLNLDESNQLRKYAVANDVTAINKSLSEMLKFNFYVVIFNKTTNTTIMPEFSSNKISVLDYHISGDYGNYSPRIIKVFIWV